MKRRNHRSEFHLPRWVRHGKLVPPVRKISDSEFLNKITILSKKSTVLYLVKKMTHRNISFTLILFENLCFTSLLMGGKYPKSPTLFKRRNL